MQKKAYDPRAKVANPFVQAYVEKQTQLARPIGEAQSFVNVLLICGMVINFFVLLLVGWSVVKHTTPPAPEFMTGEGENLPMADAVSRIQQLEANFATMQASVEFHKNAYYKLEGDYENMKAAMARMQTSGDAPRADFNSYPMPPAAMAALINGANGAKAAPATPLPQPIASNDDEAPTLPSESASAASAPKVITQQYLNPRVRGQ